MKVDTNLNYQQADAIPNFECVMLWKNKCTFCSKYFAQIMTSKLC